ncbi:MAG: class I SAM-dependent methyltransferase [Patescibacteria group bacterium]|nr:class I SAM-dependent methyltransferase [Patescibacteria group bacterium]
MKTLNSSEIWSFEAQAIHTVTYEHAYLNALKILLHDKEVKIIDTAAGVGFPTNILYDAGYHNITGLDGDSDSAAYSSKSFKDKGMTISVAVGTWQTLSKTINDKFDVLLNVDNALVYMDGWSDDKNIVSGKDAVFKRFSIVLKEFLTVLKPGGMAILGLGKHYEPTQQGIPEGGGSGDNKVIPFDLIRDGEPVTMTWTIKRDWNTRHHYSHASVRSRNYVGDIVRAAYLITKDELMQLMKEAGFFQVHLLVPDSTRDNLIIGIK